MAFPLPQLFGIQRAGGYVLTTARLQLGARPREGLAIHGSPARGERDEGDGWKDAWKISSVLAPPARERQLHGCKNISIAGRDICAGRRKADWGGLGPEWRHHHVPTGEGSLCGTTAGRIPPPGLSPASHVQAGLGAMQDAHLATPAPPLPILPSPWQGTEPWPPRVGVAVREPIYNTPRAHSPY